MGKQSTSRRLGDGLERLESRSLLAADVSVVQGDLFLSGTAEGPISIVDLGDGTLQVTQQGAGADGTDLVSVESGVTDDIFIRLQPSSDSVQNQVTLDLTKNSVAIDQVMARLGNGTNQFELLGGTIHGSLYYLGGSGADALLLDDGSVVERSVVAVLGNGSNSVSVGGKIDRGLSLRGGIDDDTIDILATAWIQGNAILQAGDGVNKVQDSGKISGSLLFVGGAGNDSLKLDENASIDGSLVARFGDGTNDATIDGAIGGSLAMVSKNADDALTVSSTAIVGGETTLGAGEEFSLRRGGRGHGRGHGSSRPQVG
ncbi:MAG: hypothetical protein ACK5OB_00105 [Pirellula sp.]